ncbi:hypothetical protein HMSSN036_92470 [Paenibacillus macerans]|nr:hypothetical protein HMSSN036_92470 [Paenibacillus macerans]
MSIRLRLTAWYTGILAVTLILFSASIYGLVYYNTYQEVKNRVIEQADQILKTQNITVTQGWDMQLDPDQIIRLEDARIFWQLNNYVIGTYRTSPGLRERKISFPIPEMKDIQNGKFQPITINGNSYMLYERALGLNDHTIVGLLQLAADTNAEDRLMKQMRTVILFGSLFTIVMASSLGLFLARKSMAPIGKVIEAANGIQTGTI